MEHLTDNELIDYVLKFDTDPIRVRLAGVMDRMPGCILDSLEDAGMDPETCLFENTWDPGQYIRHLESELDFINRELQEAQEKIRELDARTVGQLISELHGRLERESIRASLAVKYQHEAEAARDDAKEKLKMWNHLRTP